MRGSVAARQALSGKGFAMNLKTLVTGTLIVVLIAVPAWATTFVSVKKSDPIGGEMVTVHDVISYGSYIYDAPSKYDQVFWPFPARPRCARPQPKTPFLSLIVTTATTGGYIDLRRIFVKNLTMFEVSSTEESWIWFCPGSGYASFGDDFDKVTAEEKARLSLWLKDNYNASQKPTTHKEKLAWLEKVYAQRQKDREFWCRFWRLMAYAYADEPQTSLAYVAKALPLLEKQLQAGPEGIARIRVLFLLGEYHRRTGDTRAARRYFRQAKAAEYTDEDGAKRTGHPYFLELVKDKEPSSYIWSLMLAGTVCALAIVTAFFLRWRGKTKTASGPADSDNGVAVPGR